MASKAVRSEASSVAVKIKSNKAEWYIADVELGDDSDSVLESVPLVCKTLGKTRCNFMIISAGIKNITVVVQSSSPGNEALKVLVRKWLETSMEAIPKSEIVSRSEGYSGDFDTYYSIVTIDTPFKMKDVVRGAAFAFLKTNNLIKEESDEENWGIEDF